MQIKVSHIPGHTKWMAIPDCLQYHTGRSGTFRSFNHPTGKEFNISAIFGHCYLAFPDKSKWVQLKRKTLPYKHFLPTGIFIQAQLYQICIRQEEGSCSIAYTTRQVDSSVDAFDMHGAAAKVIFNHLITK